MKRPLVVLSAAALFLAGAAGGYWLGFRDAWYLGIAADSLPRGVVATHQLRYLRAGTPGPVIAALEFDVDKGLTQGADVLDHPLRGLFEPLWGIGVYPGYERHATQLANHRRLHPSLLEPGIFGKNPDLVLDAQDTKARIDRRVERYSTAK
jgi:hypothetical protein